GVRRASLFVVFPLPKRAKTRRTQGLWLKKELRAFASFGSSWFAVLGDASWLIGVAFQKGTKTRRRLSLKKELRAFAIFESSWFVARRGWSRVVVRRAS